MFYNIFDFQSCDVHEVISAIFQTNGILSGISSAVCWVAKIMCLSYCCLDGQIKKNPMGRSVACMEDKTDTYRVLVGRAVGKRSMVHV